jgi:hypothetical protein
MNKLDCFLFACAEKLVIEEPWRYGRQVNWLSVAPKASEMSSARMRTAPSNNANTQQANAHARPATITASESYKADSTWLVVSLLRVRPLPCSALRTRHHRGNQKDSSRAGVRITFRHNPLYWIARTHARKRRRKHMDEAKLRQLERQYKLRVKTGCGTCR